MVRAADMCENGREAKLRAAALTLAVVAVAAPALLLNGCASAYVTAYMPSDGARWKNGIGYGLMAGDFTGIKGGCWEHIMFGLSYEQQRFRPADGGEDVQNWTWMYRFGRGLVDGGPPYIGFGIGKTHIDHPLEGYTEGPVTEVFVGWRSNWEEANMDVMVEAGYSMGNPGRIKMDSGFVRSGIVYTY